MTESQDDPCWRLLCRIADEQTTKSFKRTINAAFLLRAARDPTRRATAVPRKTTCIVGFLGFAALMLGQHPEWVRILLHFQL